MVAFALDRANAIDVVIVYNFSRSFRNVAAYLQYRTLLKNAGVRLISATQDVPEGATDELIETIFAAFDGHASDVNAATVRDMMIDRVPGCGVAPRRSEGDRLRSPQEGL